MHRSKAILLTCCVYVIAATLGSPTKAPLLSRESTGSQVNVESISSLSSRNVTYFRSDGNSIANAILDKTGNGEKDYYASNYLTANWYNAGRICQLHGMRLASVESQQQYDRLKEGLNKLGINCDRYFWLGASDLGQWNVHSFYWASNGRPLTFADWGPGEPNNGSGDEDCLELVALDGGRTIYWNDHNCLDEKFVICEKDYQLFSRIA